MTEYDYEFKEDDIDWSAAALAAGQDLEIVDSGGFSASAVVDRGSCREHTYRNGILGIDLRIEVDGRGFKMFIIDKPWDNPPPRLVKSGSLSDLSIFSVERFLSSALRHGVDSDPDHEVGDLQEYLRSMWEILTPEQKLAFARKESVVSTLAAAEGMEADDLISASQLRHV